MSEPLSSGNWVAETLGKGIEKGIEIIGGWLDNMFEGIRGMGKSALINVEGLGSKLNPMNLMKQNPLPSPMPSTSPKLGRNAHHHEIGTPSIEKPSIQISQPTISRHQGAFEQARAAVGFQVADVSVDSLGNMAPNCQHYGTSMNLAAAMGRG